MERRLFLAMSRSCDSICAQIRRPSSLSAAPGGAYPIRNTPYPIRYFSKGVYLTAALESNPLFLPAAGGWPVGGIRYTAEPGVSPTPVVAIVGDAIMFWRTSVSLPLFMLRHRESVKRLNRKGTASPSWRGNCTTAISRRKPGSGLGSG